MDFTQRNKIRNSLDFLAISKIVFRKFFRTDIDVIFNQVKKEKQLNDTECETIKIFLLDLIVNGEREKNKTSYYHIAHELFNQIKATKSDNEEFSLMTKITKEFKLNINEVVALKAYMANNIIQKC